MEEVNIDGPLGFEGDQQEVTKQIEQESKELPAQETQAILYPNQEVHKQEQENTESLKVQAIENSKDDEVRQAQVHQQQIVQAQIQVLSKQEEQKSDIEVIQVSQKAEQNGTLAQKQHSQQDKHQPEQTQKVQQQIDSHHKQKLDIVQLNQIAQPIQPVEQVQQQLAQERKQPNDINEENITQTIQAVQQAKAFQQVKAEASPSPKKQQEQIQPPNDEEDQFGDFEQNKQVLPSQNEPQSTTAHSIPNPNKIKLNQDINIPQSNRLQRQISLQKLVDQIPDLSFLYIRQQK